MKIVENERGFELHIISSLTDNIVSYDNKCYDYKRLVIPNVLMNYFFERNSNLEYVYFYFLHGSVFMSIEKIPQIKYSRRRLLKFKDKNSYFITLNEKSFLNHCISPDSDVLFIVSMRNNSLSSDCMSIELRF